MTTTTARPPEIAPAPRSWRTTLIVFAILMVAATLGSAAILPYAFSIAGTQVPDVSIWIWLPFAVAQNMALIAPLTALGLWLGGKVGLGAPLLSALVEREPGATDRLRGMLPFAVGVGAVAGAILIVGALAFVPWLPAEYSEGSAPPWWQAVLASVSAGITEELMLRLGVMTLLVWIGTKVTRQDTPSSVTIWVANALAALLFGAGHLPLAASIAPLTAMVVIRTLALNVFAGMVFGWMYWRRGLLAAIVAHTSADIVLHVLSRPLLMGL